MGAGAGGVAPACTRALCCTFSAITSDVATKQKLTATGCAING
jgi:hypothetical protein